MRPLSLKASVKLFKFSRGLGVAPSGHGTGLHTFIKPLFLVRVSQEVSRQGEINKLAFGHSSLREGHCRILGDGHT